MPAVSAVHSWKEAATAASVCTRWSIIHKHFSSSSSSTFSHLSFFSGTCACDVYALTHVHRYVVAAGLEEDVHACVCTCMWKPKVMTGILTSLLSLCTMRQVSKSNGELTNTVNEPYEATCSKDPLSLPPETRITRWANHTHTPHIFFWIWGHK